MAITLRQLLDPGFTSASKTRILNGYCRAQGYTIPNPLTKTQFAKKSIIFHVKESVRQSESRVAVKAAREVVNTSVDNDVVIT